MTHARPAPPRGSREGPSAELSRQGRGRRGPSGWRVEHCGHPTANHPWALYAPSGMMVLAGVQDGFPADHGHAWDTIGDVIAWVASAPARAFEVQP